jgi:CheY-like chemotaxis protein
VICREMQDLSTNSTADYYYSNKSEKIFSSIEPKTYHDSREENQRTMQYSQKQEIEDEELHNQIIRRRKTILLIDDEADHCIVYQVVLEDAGYECKPYTDSVKALQEFKPNYYDLVLLDIKMPKLDGFALCKKIRELDKTLQIIFITASELYYENFRKQYYPELSNDINISCLQKPIVNEELIQIVNLTIATRNTN